MIDIIQSGNKKQPYAVVVDGVKVVETPSRSAAEFFVRGFLSRSVATPFNIDRADQLFMEWMAAND